MAALYPVFLQKPSYRALLQTSQVSTAKGHALEWLLTELLSHLMKDTGLDSQDERMTVYFQHGDEFHNLARHSSNRLYAAQGRGSYPCDQGIIGALWENDNKIYRLPVPDAEWLRTTVEVWGFSEQEARSLSMRARCIAGAQIKQGQSWVGILVVEAMGNRKITADHLREIKESPYFRLLAGFVGTAGKHFNKFEHRKYRRQTLPGAFSSDDEWAENPHRRITTS